MDWTQLALGVGAGLLIAVLTAPVGVSGAVFLLPVQLDVLKVPSPAVTPTNLLYNIVSAPGALWRYQNQGQRPGGMAAQMLLGTIPGVLLGVWIRIHLVPDVRPFRLVAAAVLLPIGLWLVWRTMRHTASPRSDDPSRGLLAGLGLIAGVIGGIYGMGGGSILAPILVARGFSITRIAPAALASTFVTSVAGAAFFGLLARAGPEAAAPDWPLGVACGLGGLVGGYLGARWHRRLPERALTLLLGVTASALALAYVYQAVR